MHQSLRKRFILSTLTVLCVFLSVAGLVLDKTFEVGFKKTIRDRLKLHTLALLAETELVDGNIRISKIYADGGLNMSSGELLAIVSDAEGNIVWRSLSKQGIGIYSPTPVSGQWLFGRSENSAGEGYFVLSYGIRWPASEGEELTYTYTVMEPSRYYNESINAYRRALIGVLVSIGVILFALQWLVMQWGLRPLRYLTRDLSAINQGESQFLSGNYPLELKPLTSNLNLLIANERRQGQNYRNSLADLSHSLKTPLTVLQGLETDSELDGSPLSRGSLMAVLSKQVMKMKSTIDYQLQRAVGTREHVSIVATLIKPEVEAIVSALDKVYIDRRVSTHIVIDQSAVFFGDENDLIEVLGNVLDNAYKHCRGTVRISVVDAQSEGESPHLCIVIEDDGEGIDSHYRRSVLTRGIRLDTRTTGQGVGLAIVADIVSAYKGHITISESELGGACFQLFFPRTV